MKLKEKKKKIAEKMLVSQFCQLRILFFDQNSPVQPIPESRGGPLSVTEGQSRKSINPCVQYRIADEMFAHNFYTNTKNRKHFYKEF